LVELDSRVKVTIAGTGIHTWGQQLTTQYNQLYAMDLKADAFELGILNSVTAAISSISSVPLGWAAEKYSVKKVMLLGFALSIISSVTFALSSNWLMLIPAFVMGSKLIRIMPLTDIIFISATEPERRTSVMSFSRVIWGGINVFAPMTAAVIVAHFGGINAHGIRPLYYIQIGLTLVVLVLVAKYLRPLEGLRGRDSGASVGSSFIGGYLSFFKGEKWLKRWVALRIVRQFGINLALPFVPLWMVNVKGVTPYILGLIGTSSMVMALVFQIPAGRLSDVIGRKKVYFLLRPLCFAGTLLMILAPGPEYLIGVGVLGAVALGAGIGGGVGGVSSTPFVTMFWEMVPQEKRGRWFGIEGLMNLSTIPASILGGFLWQQGLKVEVLLIPIILEVLIVMPILATIPDTLRRTNNA
jgi:MFS family permease